MSNQVLLKKSAVAAKVPQASDLAYGEVAINYADGKLYFKDSSNNVKSFVSSAADLLTLIKTVDGTGSGLDADLLDGLSEASFARSGANTNITSLGGLTGAITTPTYIDFAGTSQTAAAGRLWYDSATGSWNAGMGGGNTTQQIGEETFVYAKASANITNGQVVMRTGTVGNSGVISVAPASINVTDPNLIIGVATESITSGSFGRITTFGTVRGINTSGSTVGETWVDGDVLWYNPSVTGGLTKNKPAAPNQKTQMAIVISAHASNGSIHIQQHDGTQLGGTDSNVEITSVANLDLLQYNTSTTRWENKAAANVSVGNADKVDNYHASESNTASTVAVRDSSKKITASGHVSTAGLFEHANVISEAYVIASGNNAFSAGPITVTTGGSVTIPDGSIWTVV